MITTVKKWVHPLRFGFLANPDPAGEDIFVSKHDLTLRPSHGQRLFPGETVECDLETIGETLHARNVTFPIPVGRVPSRGEPTHNPPSSTLHPQFEL